MYALTPSARKRQQMLLQLNNQQRKTRQIDAKTRQTNNSRNEKLFNLEQDFTKKKKQKLQPNNSNTDNDGIKNNESKEHYSGIESSNVVDKENSGYGTSNIDSEEEDTDLDNLETSGEKFEKQLFLPEKVVSGNDESIEEKYYVSSGVLGEGHISLLHAYVRDDLFKNIKILSPSHLETKGEIMKDCLKLLMYSESRNGNLTAFANACRAEIRKTMCSRRGYVKRQTGITLKGKIL